MGRILWRRREDILAYFDIGASNGPVEAINGRLEHLRGIARRVSVRLCTGLIYKRFALAFPSMQSLPKTGRSYFNIKYNLYYCITFAHVFIMLKNFYRFH